MDLYRAGDDDDGGGAPIGRLIERAPCQGECHVAAEILLPQEPGTRYALGSPAGPTVALRVFHALASERPA
jgi:hypothetical protein